jgi:hypothetical protein
VPFSLIINDELPLLCQLSYLAAKVVRARNMERRGFCASKFSRAIDFDRLDLAAMTMHVDSDGTTTNFAITQK